MSWPQWPQPTGAVAGWSGTGVAPPAQAVAPLQTQGTPYTPEQWAAMQQQQQNWQQWVQWQQQYQQWQQQYGEQYQKSLALAGQTPTVPLVPVQPPLPAVDPKAAPPLPSDIRPPLPPEEPPRNVPATTVAASVTYNVNVPPPNVPPPQPHVPQTQQHVPQIQPQHQHNKHGLQQQNITQRDQHQQMHSSTGQTYGPNQYSNTNQPPSLLSLPTTKPPFIDNQTQSRNKNFRSEFGNKRPGDFHNDNFEEAKKNRWESNVTEKPEQKQWNTNQSQQRNQQWNASKPAVQRPNVEELSEAEKNFDKQFEQWEAQFNKWKEQNAGHPDKQQYKEYEAKWESWRTQLLERREQMRKKRLGLHGSPAQSTGPKASASFTLPTGTLPVSGVHQQQQQQQQQQQHQQTKPVIEPTINKDLPISPATTPEKIKENVTETISATTESANSSENDISVLFSQPPKEQRTNIRQRRASIKSDSEGASDTSFLQSNTDNAGGIPGLDLVKDDDSKLPDNKDEEKKAEIDPKLPDYEAISKGINSILGDEKLLNMLSMVAQNKKIEQSSTNSQNITPNSNNPVQDEINNSYQSNDSFNNQSFSNDPFGKNQFNKSFEQQNQNRDTQSRGPPGPNNFNDFRGPVNFNQPPPNNLQGMPGNNEFNKFPMNRGEFESSNRGPGEFGPQGRGSFTDFNQGPPNNYNRGPNNFNQGPPGRGQGFNKGSGDFNQGPPPRGPGNFNQGPPNRGPGDFNPGQQNRGSGGPPFRGQGDMNQGPQNRGHGDFNQEPPNRGGPGPFNQGSLNRGADFNQGPSKRGLGNFNQGPPRGSGDFDRDSNDYNQGPSQGPLNRREPDDFSQPPPNKDSNDFSQRPPNRGQNDFNQGPPNRGPGNFNQGPLLRGPNDFNQPPPNRGPNNFNQPPPNRGLNDFNKGPPNRDPNDFNQGPPNRGANNLNQGPPNRDTNDFKQGPPNRGANDFNQGPPNRSANDFNQGPPNRGENDFNQGPQNRPPVGFNQGPPNRGPGDFNKDPQNKASEDFNQNQPSRGLGDFNQGPPNRGSEFNQGPQNTASGDFNQGPFNRGNFNQPPPNRGSGNFNQGPPNRGPGDFNSGPLNKGSGDFNHGPSNRGSGEFNQGPPNRGINDFNQRPPNRGPTDMNRGPNNINQGPNWGPNNRGPQGQGPDHQRSSHFNPTNVPPNRDQWNQDNRAPEDFPNDDFSGPPRNPNQVPPNDSTQRGLLLDREGHNQNPDNFDNSQEVGLNRPGRWNEDNFSGDNQYTESPRFPNPSMRRSNPEQFNRGSNEKYWDEALILKPVTVIDYGHKSLNKPETNFIEPVQTFDYGHTSKNVDKKLPNIQPSHKLPGKFNKFNDPHSKFNDPVPKLNNPVSKFNPPSKPPPFMSGNKQDDSTFYRKSYDNRKSHSQEKFDRFSYKNNKSMETSYENDKNQYEDIDDYEDDPFEEPEFNRSSNERELEPFVNKPNPSFENESPLSKIKEKSSITMIEDLLAPPGRNSRPPRIAIILRGPPGSGKTFLAKLIKDKEVEHGGCAPRILSLDDYFMVDQDKEVFDEETRRKTIVKEMVYEYEECMELAYRQSLEKAFKKTITDGFFPFIILDCVNEKVKHFSEMWSFAKQNGFQVYVCQMELDVAACTKRNIHHRSEIEIERLVAGWEPTPSHHLTLDATSLIQSGCISEVEMEEVIEIDDEDKDDDDIEGHVISKWERMEPSGDKLARLDGTSKPLRPRATMEDYLQLDDDIPEEKPGLKRVRWADLEERRQQEKIRAIGFVVGQTDWGRMMDPTQGSSALTQTKYIERVRRF